MTLLGRPRTDPLTGEVGVVRTVYKHCARCITPQGRLFRYPKSPAEFKRLAQGRYRAEKRI